MKFAKEGYLPASIPALAALAALAVSAIGGPSWLGWPVAAVLALVALAVLLFFRDPQREPAGGPGAIISPADGRIVSVDRDRAGHRLHPERSQRVSIFMSPLDVHINRMPADATVEAVEYSRGSFRAAYADDASDVNESNALLVRTPEGVKMVVVQIAGWLARRIVCDVDRGDSRRRGERFGLIMFGSRVDVYLPGHVSISVRRGQRVAAGRTVIAEPDNEAAEQVAESSKDGVAI